MNLKRSVAGFVSICICCICFYTLRSGAPYAILTAREGAGLFSMMTDVAAIANAYEQGKISGFEVDFGQEGVYYEAARGKNWWLYLFNPLKVGSQRMKKKIKGTYGSIPGVPPYEFWSSRHEVYQLVSKYVTCRPEIMSVVDQFCEKHFKGFSMVGIHYRGTDWISENQFRKIPYALFAEHAETFLRDNPHCKLFIATDEQPFLDYMIDRLGSRVCYQEAYRSRDDVPVHKDPRYSHQQQAEEALIDCLLLSRTEYLLGSCSNLSRWASFFNPDIPYVDLGTVKF